MVTKEHLTAAAKITSEMSRSCCSSRNQGERAGHHHGRGVGRLWGRRLPPPRSPTAPEERAFPLHVPLRREPAVPAGGRVGFRSSRNSLSREACAGEKGGGGGRKEREARVRFAGSFSETTI